MRGAFAVLIVCSLVGCSRTGEQTGAASRASTSAISIQNRAEQVADRNSLRTGNDALRTVRMAIASGQDPMIACAMVAICADELRPSSNQVAARFVREADRLCSFEAPLQWAEHNIRRIEGMRAQDPTAGSISECAQLDKALDDLESNGSDDTRVQALEAKRQELCGA